MICESSIDLISLYLKNCYTYSIKLGSYHMYICNKHMYNLPHSTLGQAIEHWHVMGNTELNNTKNEILVKLRK